MSAIKRIAEEITQGLDQVLPDLNKPVVRKLSLAVGAVIAGQTPMAWLAEEGAVNIGFAKQKTLLDSVLAWFKEGCASDAVSRLVLSLDGFVSTVKRQSQALPLAPKRLSTGRSWRWR